MLRAAFAALALTLLTGAAALAQQDGYRVIEAADPPRGADLDRLMTEARLRRIDTGMIYVTRLQGDLADGPAIELSRPDVSPRRDGIGVDGGSVSAMAVIGLFLLGLVLWMRFGGSGNLLAAAPKPDRLRHAAPESWALTEAERMTDPQTLLDQIAAMPDRSAAMVRLLHHCLLFAGDDSDTRFARADTERDAFRRLPDGWRFHQPLALLLNATELAHYGGRAVDEAGFVRALETGRQLLIPKKPAHA